MNTIILILWTVFGFAFGGFIMWFFLSEIYDKKWFKEYGKLKETEFLYLKWMSANKDLVMFYIDTMEKMWCGYKRMYDTYETIKDDFDFIKRNPVTGKEEFLNDIPKLVEARLKELDGSDESFAKILGLDMDKIDIWKQDTHIDDLVPHGKIYLKTEKEKENLDQEIEKMKELLENEK